ncbi:hypothetical protein D3C75_899850 [compost metagenome]
MQAADVHLELRQVAPKELHAVRAREENPIISFQRTQRGSNLGFLLCAFRHDRLNDRELVGFPAELLNAVHQLAGLAAGAGHYDALAEQRLRFYP